MAPGRAVPAAGPPGPHPAPPSTRRCPTCKQHLVSPAARLARELVAFGLLLLPLALAVATVHLPVWLAAWGWTGLAVALLAPPTIGTAGPLRARRARDHGPAVIVVTTAHRPNDRK